MRMHLHRNATRRRDERGQERARALRRQQSGRILDGNVVGAELDELLRASDVIRIGVHRAQRVGQHRIDLHAGVVTGANRRFDVAIVVQRVVNGQHRDASLREHHRVECDDVVGKELERVEALAARQRVAGCGQTLAQQADALPRILLQVADAHVEHRAAQDIDERIADAVDRCDDRRHHRGGHARRPQALVRVAQRHVDEAERAVGRPWRFAVCCVRRHHRRSRNTSSTNLVWTSPRMNRSSRSRR